MKTLMVGISVLLVLAALAMPLKQRCGAPGRSCATAVDASGNVHYYYEVEPLGVFIVESVLGSDIPLYYTSGEEIVKVR
jgi:DNA-binding IclR family transcriptional regulator